MNDEHKGDDEATEVTAKESLDDLGKTQTGVGIKRDASPGIKTESTASVKFDLFAIAKNETSPAAKKESSSPSKIGSSAPARLEPSPSTKTEPSAPTKTESPTKTNSQVFQSETQAGPNSEGTRIVHKETKSFFDNETVIRAPVTGGQSERIPPKSQVAAPAPYQTDEQTVGHQTQSNYRTAQEPTEESSFNTSASIRIARTKGAEKISGPKFKLFKRKIRATEWALLATAILLAYVAYSETHHRPTKSSSKTQVTQANTKDQFLSDMMRVMEQTKIDAN